MENNDIIRVDYDCWIKDTKKLYTTTKKEVAEEHEIFDEKKTYEPEIVIVGASRAIKGLDESFLNAEIDKEYELEIKPEEAFGNRDPKLIELHKIHKLRRMKIEPYTGQEIEFEGRKGTILRVTGSRVRIDFNNPLAGKTLKYKYKIIEKAETIEEKIITIIDLEYRGGEEFELEINEKEIKLKIPLFCKTDKEWFNVKLKIVADLRKYLDFENISFIEEYVSRKPIDEIEVEEEKEKSKEEIEEENKEVDEKEESEENKEEETKEVEEEKEKSKEKIEEQSKEVDKKMKK